MPFLLQSPSVHQEAAGLVPATASAWAAKPWAPEGPARPHLKATQAKDGLPVQMLLKLLRLPSMHVTSHSKGSYGVVLTAKQLGGRSLALKFMSIGGSPRLPAASAQAGRRRCSRTRRWQ